MNNPEDRIKYCYMSKTGHIISLYTDCFEDAKQMAMADQPDRRPYYILESTQHFEIVDVVEAEGEK